MPNSRTLTNNSPNNEEYIKKFDQKLQAFENKIQTKLENFSTQITEEVSNKMTKIWEKLPSPPPQTTEIREHHSRREWKGAKWNGRQKNKGTNLDNIQISGNHRNRQWRKKKTWLTQLLEMLDYWTARLDAGLGVDAIYLDFQKSFDWVPHQRLLRKISSYGISRDIVKWIKAFLTDHQQKKNSKQGRIRLGRCR